MKRSRIIVLFLIVALSLTSFSPISANATVTGTVIIGLKEDTICTTRGRAQNIFIQSTAQLIIKMYDSNNTLLWDSRWSGEYLDYNSYYDFTHSYWCGSDVYRINAFAPYNSRAYVQVTYK